MNVEHSMELVHGMNLAELERRGEIRLGRKKSGEWMSAPTRHPLLF